MPNEGNEGAALLASVIDSRIKEQIPSDLKIDFGDILAGYQLKTNTFKPIIPPHEYMVCRQLTLGETGERLTNVTTPEGAGQAYVPEKMRGLLPGDRVLVVWVQDTAVVVDLLVRADKI